VNAEGKALAAKKFNEQLKQDPQRNFLTLKRIETAKEIAKSIGASQNRVLLSSESLMFDLTPSPPKARNDSQTNAEWGESRESAVLLPADQVGHDIFEAAKREEERLRAL